MSTSPRSPSPAPSSNEWTLLEGDESNDIAEIHDANYVLSLKQENENLKIERDSLDMWYKSLVAECHQLDAKREELKEQNARLALEVSLVWEQCRHEEAGRLRAQKEAGELRASNKRKEEEISALKVEQGRHEMAATRLHVEKMEQERKMERLEEMLKKQRDHNDENLKEISKLEAENQTVASTAMQLQVANNKLKHQAKTASEEHEALKAEAKSLKSQTVEEYKLPPGAWLEDVPQTDYPAGKEELRQLKTLDAGTSTETKHIVQDLQKVALELEGMSGNHAALRGAIDQWAQHIQESEKWLQRR